VVELLVVVVIMGVLALLAITAMRPLRTSGRRMKCAANLRQIAVLMAGYLADNNGYYPIASEELKNSKGENIGVREFWPGKLVKHSGLQNYNCFVCPGLKTEEVHPDLVNSRKGNDFAFAYVSYGINRYALSPSLSEERGPINARKISEPSKVLMLVDFDSKSQPNMGWHLATRATMLAGWDYNRERHHGAVNVLFCDGHVELVTSSETMGGKAAGGEPWFEKQFY